MKNKYLILTIIGIALIAVFTNPNQDRHKEVLKNKMNSYLQKSLTKTNSDREILGAMLGGVLVNVVVNNVVSTDNYVLFSTTKISWKGKSKVIGIGVFGNVYITSELGKAMEDGLLDENK